MDGGTTNDAVEALVAEATSSLFGRIPRDVFDLDELVPSNDAQNAWNRQLAAWRLEAERLCEPRIPRWNEAEVGESLDTRNTSFRWGLPGRNHPLMQPQTDWPRLTTFASSVWVARACPLSKSPTTSRSLVVSASPRKAS
jgi:hypothetical protein